jgi:dinuclear metal center YbgI/SA1388 family protein
VPESLPNLSDLWQYNRSVPPPLSEVIAALERLAPLSFAEPWDNVGLLVEPQPVASAPPVACALLTIDLSDDVVTEAEQLGASLIVAYHPPIFQGLKRLRSSEPGERAVLRCATQGIAVFSPHTALDAAPGGVNDWLLDAFGPGERRPCIPHAVDARFGQGRSVKLSMPLTLTAAIGRVKRHLGLSQLRVAACSAHADDTGSIRTVAVCAGAGGSVFEKLSGFDLFLTGEMRHHDVRSRVAQGSSVILSEHTHTERGYLQVLSEWLSAGTGGSVPFHLSKCDKDPLALV